MLMRIFHSLFLSIFISLLFIPFGLAADLSFKEDSLKNIPTSPVINQTTRIYLQLVNTSNTDMKGVVRAYDITESKRIDIEQTFTTVSQGDADVFWDFAPSSAGVHEIAFRIIPWENYPENNTDNDKIIKKIFVDYDSDNDGIGDQVDTDDDNDGVDDKNDPFPLDATEWEDIDSDGIGDNIDNDDDNDGIDDEIDAFPSDSSEGIDTDNDGIGDNTDEDDDNDGVKDENEIRNGTDPLLIDTDNDGIDDGIDDYPKDKRYTKDTDRDGQPNKIDNDDDNDGVKDENDAFPEDKNEWEDFDGDGIGDIADNDDDNDFLEDDKEQEIGTNPRKNDTDGDGVKDGEDDLPLNEKENKDSDNDGVGDNADPFDDNKGPEIKLSKLGPYKSNRNDVFEISAESSIDPEGGNLSFLWEVIGSNGEIIESRNTPNFGVRSSSVGTVHIRVTVTDEKGESRFKSISVDIHWSKWDKYLFISGIIGLGVAVFLGYRYIRKKRK